MSFQIILTEESEKFLKKCDKSILSRIVDKLEQLKDNPHLGKPLTANMAGLWSLRIGDYRAIYEIKDNQLKIIILKVAHRKNVYE